MKKRKFVFEKTFAIANNAIIKKFINHESYFKQNINNSRNLFCFSQLYSNISIKILFILFIYKKKMQLNDASSMLNFNVFLIYFVQQIAENQQSKNILN